MNFPNTVYGRCDFTGHLGPEYSSGSTNLHTNADAVHGATGSGYKLVEFEGKFVCPACKKRIIADRESIDSARKHSEEERFRANAGFTRLIDD